MPIPRIVRQWNKAGLNRVTKHIAPWAPGFGVVIHRGRRSGRLYQTPVNVFAAGDVRHGSIKRVASAVGEGSIATTQMTQYLQDQTGSS